MEERGTLVFFCGKMGAGKTTEAKRLVQELSAVLLSEDEWLAKLFPEEINDFEDYIKYSRRLKSILLHHIQGLLKMGTSVVLDFPGNTKKQRQWFKTILADSEVTHQLIYLDVPDEVCLKRLSIRREEQPERAKFDTEEVFKQVTAYSEAPTEDEDFNVIAGQASITENR